MKIVRNLGGLGNQMFQYAFYKALKKRFRGVKLDLSGYADYPLHNGFELERIFDLQLDKVSPFTGNVFNQEERKWIFRKIRRLFNLNNAYIAEKTPFSYDQEILKQNKIQYYWGYWQNPSYFADIAAEIKKDFDFKLPLDAQNQHVLKEIRSSNSVALHVRRGDYMNDLLLGGLCGDGYYQRAIDYIQSKIDTPHYFVFSDDISWCTENLKMENTTFISWNKGSSSYIDMQLMSSCKHNIIANSSFSWWGAWLNNYPLKLVIGPEKWVNDDSVSTEGLFPDNWIRL